MVIFNSYVKLTEGKSQGEARSGFLMFKVRAYPGLLWPDPAIKLQLSFHQMLHLIVGHPHRTHPSHAQGEFHGGPGLSANFAARVVVGSLALRSPRHAVALRLDGEGEMDQDLTNQGIQMDLGCFNHPMNGS